MGDVIWFPPPRRSPAAMTMADGLEAAEARYQRARYERDQLEREVVDLRAQRGAWFGAGAALGVLVAQAAGWWGG